MNDELFKFIISRLLEDAKEARNELDENGKDDYSKGLSIGYYSFLDTIKSELKANGLDVNEYGLGINLEKEFL